jgi:hypothetical protein
MKRREFLGAPAALLVLPFAGVAGNAAAADTLQFTMLRLSGSGGDGEVTGGWQSAWPQAPASLSRARIVFRGVVPATTSTLGSVDVQSAFFADKGLNLALIYSARTGGVVSGSKAISFHAQAASFGGLVITPITGQRSVRTPTTVTLGDTRTGRLTQGRYVLLHAASKVNPSDFVWSGYDDRPLRRRDRRAIDVDYLVFDVEPA